MPEKNKIIQPNKAVANDQIGSPSVHRVLRIFDYLLESGEPVSIGTLIDALNIPKSTAYELVRTLTEANYIEASGTDGGLFLGRKLFQLGMAYRSQVDLLKDGSQIVRALRDLTGETVQFSVLVENYMQVLMKEEGIRPIRIVSHIGSRIPINWAASGRLLVSDLDDNNLAEILRTTMTQSPSGKACMDSGIIIEQIRAFRFQGYGTELSEANDHAGCVSAPVIDEHGKCVAAISVVVPEQRLAPPNREVLIKAVTDAAAQLSQRISGQ